MTNVVDLDSRRRAQTRAAHVVAAPNEPELPLYGGGGGGTLPPMIPIKDYIDKADEAVETRLAGKLDKLSTKTTIWAAVATILGVLLSVLAFAGNRFDAGLSLAGQRQTQMVRDTQQDEALRRIDNKLDRILVERAPSGKK